MRQEIIEICVQALRKSGHPGATAENVFTDDAHGTAFLDLLRDCRPLKVVRELIKEVEDGRAAPHGGI